MWIQLPLLACNHLRHFLGETVMPQQQKCHADDIIKFYIITAASDNKCTAKSKRAWILGFSMTSIKIWRIGTFSSSHLSEPHKETKGHGLRLWLVDFDLLCVFLCSKVCCFWTSLFGHMFLKSAVSFTLALTFFNFFILKHGKFRFPRWNCCYILYTQIWEGKNKLVRFCLHLDLPLLLVYIAAFIWQTQWIIATEMVWLTLQKNPKCWNVFDNAGRMFFQNSCNLVVIGLQLSLVFFCKRASAKLKCFLWRTIYIIYIPEILIICKRFVAFTFDLCDLLCFVCNS